MVPPVLALLMFALLPGPALAQLNPGLKEPYKLDVVLRFAEHRSLTPTFQEEIRRQVGDLLRLNFGALAQVRVLAEHRLLKDVEAKGLGAVLDGWEGLSDVKTHFVLIDYEGGRYRLRARQHDGLTGLASPVVRQEWTTERRLVARTAAQLVDRDFGLVGTVTGQGKLGVEVTFRGGGLGVSLQRWLKPGDVLGVSRISQAADKTRASRVEWALLRVTSPAGEGTWRCGYFHRYRDDRLEEGPGIQGFRCLRLATVSAPLRLRLLDDKTLVPLAGQPVHVSHTGFGEAATELTTGADGLLTTPEPFAGAAFVHILSGKEVRVQLPVEIVDDRIVVCRASITLEAMTRDRVQLRYEHWLRRLYEDLRVVHDRVGRLNALLENAPEEALTQSRKGLAGLSREIDALTLEHGELEQAAAGQPEGAIDLGEGEQRLRELRDQRDQLNGFIARLENVITEEKSDKARARRTMLERAVLLESQADFEGALDLYRKLLKDNPDETRIKGRLQELEKAWQTKGTDHEKARSFIYGAWPKKMDTAGLKTALPEAWKALRACQHAGDSLTPQKMLQADVAHAGWFKERLAVLRRTPDREDSRTEARTIAALAEELGRLDGEVRAFARAKGKR
jgi:hypothetical protein